MSHSSNSLDLDLATKLSTNSNRLTRRTYGFDEISLVPGSYTLDIELCDTTFVIDKFSFKVPIIASAMDSVTNVNTVTLLSNLGAMGVLNLQGLQTRYDNPDEILDQIAKCDDSKFIELFQKLYLKPIDEKLIVKRIAELKANNARVVVSVTPNFADKYLPLLIDSDIDILVVQSTVTGLIHKSVTGSASLNVEKFCKKAPFPVIVGNCVTYKTAYDLMEAGVSAILVGIGPGAACTSRSVLGIGVPMATAIADCAQAKIDYAAKTGRYVSIVADGGMIGAGDICKAIACGADAAMIGSPLAKAKEAPGRGYHWGMATPSPILPRGTRVKVGSIGSMEEILFGPATIDDGSLNLIGALQTSMATLGASNLKEMQNIEIVIAPSILKEGKFYQSAQGLGMGRS